MSTSTYSVGNRVYNGASNAPTRGRVDPSGYVDRELNKPTMDQSQSRSGLAQAALRRLGGAGMAPPGAPGAPQAGPPGPPGAGQVPQGGPPMMGMDTQDPALMGGVPLGPPLIITPTGKLKLNPALSGGMA